VLNGEPVAASQIARSDWLLVVFGLGGKARCQPGAW